MMAPYNSTDGTASVMLNGDATDGLYSVASTTFVVTEVYWLNGEAYSSYKEYLKAFNKYRSQEVAYEKEPPPYIGRVPVFKSKHIVIRTRPMTSPSRSQIAKQKRKKNLHRLTCKM